MMNKIVLLITLAVLFMVAVTTQTEAAAHRPTLMNRRLTKVPAIESFEEDEYGYGLNCGLKLVYDWDGKLVTRFRC